MTDTTADYTPPSQLATNIAVKLWADHKDCPSYGIPGSCALGHISSDDVQEILDLAAVGVAERRED